MALHRSKPFRKQKVNEMNCKYASLIILTLVAGCAVTDRKPIVDTRGVPESRYQADLESCRKTADQVDVGRETLIQSVAGALFVGAFGIFLGDADFAARAIGTGAVMGATAGAGSSIEQRNAVLRNCLQGRGYTVLN